MAPEFVADPYPTYHRLRTEDPVHQHPLGFWVLTRYEDVVSVLRDARFVKEPIAAVVASRMGGATPPVPLSMLERDPPHHTRLRSLVSKAFTPRVVEPLRPDIQQIVDALLDRVAGRDDMELVEDCAFPRRVVVIRQLLGVLAADREHFQSWGVDIVRRLDAILLPAWSEVVQRSGAARGAMIEYFRGLSAQ